MVCHSPLSDVVKLSPGDEIRRVVRTMVSSVHRCVVFLSPEYISSPNCCIEWWEAVQRPEKMIIVVMKPLGQAIMSYLEVLQAKGAVLVEGGIDGAIPVIAKEITNSEDMSGTAAHLILSVLS